MTTEKHEIGGLVDMHCSACEQETPHSIKSVTRLGKITSAVCDTCQTASSFKGGVKTGMTAGKGKAPDVYDRKRKYKKGQAMMHGVFGHGEVTGVVEPQKIDVLFGDTTRRLLHDQQ